MEFWVVEQKMMAGRSAFARVTAPSYGVPLRCPACGRAMSGRVWLPPRRVAFESGTHTAVPGDFVTGPGFSPFLASSRFVEAWTTGNLLGVEEWSPVEVVNYNQAYYFPRFPVPSVPALLTEMRAEFDEMSGCPYCSRARIVSSYDGVILDQRRWGGADMFPLTNLSVTVVTERVVSLFQQHDFVGAKLIPARDYRPAFAKK